LAAPVFLQATFSSQALSVKNRMKKIILNIAVMALVFYCIAIMQSCNSVCSCKQVPCPGYRNTNFDQWFPYDSSQQVTYIDSIGKLSGTITIFQISTNDPYDAKQGCATANIGCSSNKYIYAGNVSFTYASTADWNGSLLDSNYAITVHEFSMNAKGLGNTGFSNVNQSSEFYNNINLNGKNFQNVQAIWMADSSNIQQESVHKIFIQKNIGLLAYQYYPSKTIVLKK
jgi:hypothetical protein